MTATQLPPASDTRPSDRAERDRSARRGVIFAVVVAAIVGALVVGSAFLAGGMGAPEDAAAGGATADANGVGGSPAIPTRLVVPSPWPVRTSVSGGSASSRSRIEVMIVGKSL